MLIHAEVMKAQSSLSHAGMAEDEAATTEQPPEGVDEGVKRSMEEWMGGAVEGSLREAAEKTFREFAVDELLASHPKYGIVDSLR